ncbi:MAG TPA: hypothetical protein VJT82_01765, partial [Pyrinomonadaceae bacterium]|nr:hypothetical protein [Pyrinomonadaceae bacterium]
LKRMLMISEASRKYTVTSFAASAEEPVPSNTPATTPARPSVGQQRGGVVTYTMTMRDTGERKPMFGFQARHIITVFKSEPSPDACDKTPVHYETDGWYVDLEFSFECLTEGASAQRPMGTASGGCVDRVRYNRVGTARPGYPVLVTTRFFDASDKESFSTTTEVVSLSRATLDPALFDVPAGYTEARNAQELFNPAAMAAAMQSAANQNDNDNQSAQNPSQSQTVMSQDFAPQAKRAGVLRIGVPILINKSDKSVDGDVLRSTLIQSLNVGNVEAVPLVANVPSAAEQEAKQKDCDFILYTDITTLKQSAANKIGGLLGRATGAGNVSERYEARLDYNLVPVGASAPLLQANASAKEDGSPDASVNSALRREAQAVLAKVRK